MSSAIPVGWTAALAEIFAKTEAAGYGIADGASFEAFPGMEDAAADYIESLTEEL